MKKIPLTNTKKQAIVDDDDYPYLSRFRWIYSKGVFATLLRDKERYVSIPMGHFIVRPNRAYSVVNHKNGNELDFRKSNLVCIREGKRTHRGKKRRTHFGRKCTSKYKGVSLKRDIGRKPMWIAQIQKDKIKYPLGRFLKEKDAAKVYNKKARELYGELAYQNKL